MNNEQIIKIGNIVNQRLEEMGLGEAFQMTISESGKCSLYVRNPQNPWNFAYCISFVVPEDTEPSELEPTVSRMLNYALHERLEDEEQMLIDIARFCGGDESDAEFVREVLEKGPEFQQSRDWLLERL